MNIRCPHCQTVFRVNPARIPPKGVRARCARCGETFTVRPPESPDAAPTATDGRAGSTQPPSAPSPGGGPTPRAAGSGAGPTHGKANPEARTQTPPAAQPAPASTPAPPVAQPAPVSTPAPAAPPASRAAPAAEKKAKAPVFGSANPTKRAERLARALVSDIVAYHPERRDKSLEDGSIRSEFREEILKSWDEYVAQVGIDTAKGTPFFRDALNAILAKGQEVF